MVNIKGNLPGKDQFKQGYYTPKNPEKYKGTLPIRYLSSWELKVMVLFDTNPCFLEWASETIKISYYNPLKKKMSTYYPDFLVKYIDRDGKINHEMIEIKAEKETLVEKAKSKYDKAQLIMNFAKWEAAKKFCESHGLVFKVITEGSLFGGKK